MSTAANSDATQPPALCEKCLGPSEHLRMLRDANNSLECKLCTRPFTVYKWKPQSNSPYKQTIICLTCSRQRNCCQCCLLDLTYGISIQMRDEVMKMAGVKSLSGGSKDLVAKNDVTKLYVAGNEKKFQSIGGAAISKDQEKAREVLRKLAIVSKQQEKEKGNNIQKNLNKDQERIEARLEKVDVSKIFSKLPLNGSITLNDKDGDALKKSSTLFIFGIDASIPDYKLTNYLTSLIPSSLLATSTNTNPIKSFVSCPKSKYAYITLSSPQMAQAICMGIEDIIHVKGNDKEKGPGRIIIDNVPMFVTRCSKSRDFPRGNLEKVKIGTLIGKFIRKLNGESQVDSNKVKNIKRKLLESSDNDDNVTKKVNKKNKDSSFTKVEKKENLITDGSFEL